MLLAAAALAAVSGVPTVSAQAPAPPVQQAAAGPILLAGSEDANTYLPAPEMADPAQGFDVQAPATPNVTYAAGFPSQAKPAVQAAINTWMGLLTSSRPIDITVEYTNTGQGTLAGASPPFVYTGFPNQPVPNTYYPPALAEALSGQDVSGGDPDISIRINTRDDWYFGTDGKTPSGKFDLQTVVLHEMAHGLGFLGTMLVSAGTGRWGFSSDTPRIPDIWDRQLEDLQGQDLLNGSVYANGSSALASALQSNNVHFNSSRTNKNLADRPKIYSPSPWNPGSSISHLDEGYYTPGTANSLVTPYINPAEAIHNPGPLALCMLEAIGWTTAQNCTPPDATANQGFSWYADGTFDKTGASGSYVSAFATGAAPNAAYKLVTGLDGGNNRPCMWDTVPVNNVVRYSNSRGFIATTAGPVNRTKGKYQLCFRQEATGVVLKVAYPLTFTVA